MLTALLSIIGEMHCSCVSDDLTITTQILDTQGQAYLGNLLLECSGGYREGETPGPIPNPEAKTLFAHNTASFRCGNVGRRQASRFSPLLQSINQSKLFSINTKPKANSIVLPIERFNQLFYTFAHSPDDHKYITYMLHNDT